VRDEATTDGAARRRTPGPPAIDLQGVDRRWGRERVLRGVSLEVTAGRIVALRGRNGSGKTTLLRLLATRLRPSAGRGRVFGHDLVREAAAVRGRVAYLSVQSGSYGPLTARENLRLAATLSGTGTDRVDEALRRVGLEPHANRMVRVFSSGMKRRLGLARLLVAEADLWLLDEPYASLDEDGRELVDALLDEARAVGRTVLVASHEPERLVGRVDATVELEQGVLRVPAGVEPRAPAEVPR
jgi:heme exporter protein A